MKKLLLSFAVLFTAVAYAQNADSLISVIFKEKTDTARIRGYYDLYNTLTSMNTVKCIQLQQKVLELAKQQKDKKLEAVMTAELGLMFYSSGCTVQATSIILEALRLAEQTGDPQVMGIVYQNMAQTHWTTTKYKELNEKALTYSTQANDYLFMSTEMAFMSDYYLYSPERNIDSALYYAEKAYHLARSKNMEMPLGFALVSLSNIHLKLGNNGLALEYLRACERLPSAKWNKLQQARIYNHYSRFYLRTGQKDSAFIYAYKSLSCSEGAFLTFELTLVATLSRLYTGVNSDSALKYTYRYIDIQDSLQKTEALSQSLGLVFAEDLRQEKLETERNHNLQFTAIAIGLMVFTILFLLFSHSVIASGKVIKGLGIVSLLIVFEFINLLIHPYLGELTHHSPVIMLGFMVCLAALLIPFHHKLEHWVTHKMVDKNNKIRLARAKKVIEQLEGTRDDIGSEIRQGV